MRTSRVSPNGSLPYIACPTPTSVLAGTRSSHRHQNTVQLCDESLQNGTAGLIFIMDGAGDTSRISISGELPSLCSRGVLAELGRFH